jgi:WD40 repeat protein
LLADGNGDAFSVCFSHDSKFVAAGSSDNLITIWNNDSDGKVVNTIRGKQSDN